MNRIVICSDLAVCQTHCSHLTCRSNVYLSLINNNTNKRIYMADSVKKSTALILIILPHELCCSSSETFVYFSIVIAINLFSLFNSLFLVIAALLLCNHFRVEQHSAVAVCSIGISGLRMQIICTFL